MLFSGKFGATESPSAAYVGLNRGPLAVLLLALGRRRCHSGTTGALSDVSSVGRVAFFFEPTIIDRRASQPPGSGAGETSLYWVGDEPEPLISSP